MVVNKILEIEKTIESLKGIKDGENFIFSLGGGVLVFSNDVNKEKVLVDIGSGIFLEKNLEESIKVLRERKGGLENFLMGIDNELEDMQKKLEEISNQLRKFENRK